MSLWLLGVRLSISVSKHVSVSLPTRRSFSWYERFFFSLTVALVSWAWFHLRIPPLHLDFLRSKMFLSTTFHSVVTLSCQFLANSFCPLFFFFFFFWVSKLSSAPLFANPGSYSYRRRRKSGFFHAPSGFISPKLFSPSFVPTSWDLASIPFFSQSQLFSCTRNLSFYSEEGIVVPHKCTFS